MAKATRVRSLPEGNCAYLDGGIFPNHATLPRKIRLSQPPAVLRLLRRFAPRNDGRRLGRLDRAKIKHLLKIFWPPPQYKKDSFIYDFCKGVDARVFGAFCRRPKCAKHEEAESKPLNDPEGRRPRRPPSEPRPKAGRTVHAPQRQPAPAGGSFDH